MALTFLYEYLLIYPIRVMVLGIMRLEAEEPIHLPGPLSAPQGRFLKEGTISSSSLGANSTDRNALRHG